jgi:hypothetical protein
LFVRTGSARSYRCLWTVEPCRQGRFGRVLTAQVAQSAGGSSRCLSRPGQGPWCLVLVPRARASCQTAVACPIAGTGSSLAHLWRVVRWRIDRKFGKTYGRGVDHRQGCTDKSVRPSVPTLRRRTGAESTESKLRDFHDVQQPKPAVETDSERPHVLTVTRSRLLGPGYDEMLARDPLTSPRSGMPDGLQCVGGCSCCTSP